MKGNAVVSVFDAKESGISRTQPRYEYKMDHGSSTYNAHVWCDLGNFICLRHNFTSKAASNYFF